jgi:O-antigen ligase
MSTATVTAAPVRASSPRDYGATAVAGERLALVTTAVAVALLPLLSPAGPANIAPVDVAVGASIASCLLWAGRTGHRWQAPYGLAMCVFFAGGALGALVGPVPVTGAIALVQDFVLVGWCWAVVNIASTPARLRVVLATWAYSAIAWATLLFVGVAGHLTYLTGQTSREGSRTALTMVDPNYSASYYVVSIMIMWASGRPRRLPARIAATVLFLAAIVSTGSNSGMVSVTVAALALTVITIHRRSGPAPAVAALAALLLVGAVAASQIHFSAVQRAAHGSNIAFLRDGLGRSDKSVGQRQMLVKESLKLYESGGPFGQGPVSTKVRLRARLSPFVKEAHDDYLAALIERGVLGLLGLALLGAGIARRIPTVVGGRLRADYAAVVPCPAALVAAVAGTMVAAAVYELLHVRHVWTLFAVLAALHVWGRR